MRFSGLVSICLSVALASCGAPPEYSEVSRAPVSLDGQQCTAVYYEVEYEGVSLITSSLNRYTGTQYKIECGGGQTVTCGLDHSLEDCIADYEQQSRRDRNSDNDTYHPPS